MDDVRCAMYIVVLDDKEGGKDVVEMLGAGTTADIKAFQPTNGGQEVFHQQPFTSRTRPT